MRFYDLDIDVKNYAKRIIDAGYKCPADINSVSDFVKGLKSYNLWGNLICWPLRANQNAGSGTMAYSLGKLGVYDGTLTNGPIWQANGINFDGINDYIIISNFTTSFLGSLFYSANHSSMTSSSPTPTSQKAMNFNGIEIGKAESASFGVEATVLTSPFPTAGRSTTIAGFGAGIQYTAAGVFNPSASSMARFYNGGSKDLNSSASYPAPTSSTTSIGTRTPSNNNSAFNGTISIAAYFNYALSDQDVLSLHTLYKSTLGKGLNLP